MHILKKVSVVILSLGSGLSFAGTMGPACTPGDVTVPCAATAWDFGAQALYLYPSFAGDPTTSNFYAVYEANGAIVARHNPYDSKWGFKLEGSYHFNTGNDFDVNWYHFDNTYKNRFQYSTETDQVDTTFNYNVKWDAVNFELGQHVDFGNHKDIRFHGGIQYARLSSNDLSRLITDYQNGILVEQNSQNRLLKEFEGAGPRFGLDLTYNPVENFGIYANGAAALLVGESRVRDTSDVLPNHSSIDRTVVPELEGKVGLKYTHGMGSGDITADVGYMAVNYFNALYTIQFNGSNNFGFSGPYFGFKWLGAV